MEKTPPEHVRLLEDIDRLLAEAPDEASRRDLERLRASMNSPQMVDISRELEKRRPRRRDELVLEFHAPLLPSALTATCCVIATAVCLYAVVIGFDTPVARLGNAIVNLWIVAAFSGALSVMFTALSFYRTFSIRFDTEGMVSRTSGFRWKRLHVGAMRWKDIRSLTERQDRVLEVRSASGENFGIPMGVVNYRILRSHLDNMVMLYGERG